MSHVRTIIHHALSLAERPTGQKHRRVPYAAYPRSTNRARDSHRAWAAAKLARSCAGRWHSYDGWQACWGAESCPESIEVGLECLSRGTSKSVQGSVDQMHTKQRTNELGETQHGVGLIPTIAGSRAVAIPATLDVIGGHLGDGMLSVPPASERRTRVE